MGLHPQMRIIIILLSIVGLSAFNSFAFIDDVGRVGKVIKGGKAVSELDNVNLITKAGKLSKVTQKSLSLSKSENIQSLMELAIKENRVDFVQQYKYFATFNKIENGDKLLLKCLKNPVCNLDRFGDLMFKSPLHVQISVKYPHMSLTQINHTVGSINENIMNKYFKSTGWTKIEGEVGRNGIDGLFIKKKRGSIVDLSIVESKYNKSGLQHTKNGQQMTKKWVVQKVKTLQKAYPENNDYNTILEFVENDTYRAMLWNLKTTDESLRISLRKVHDKTGKVVTSKMHGSEKMKINFNGNQIINIKNPANEFHSKIVSWYKKEIARIQ